MSSGLTKASDEEVAAAIEAATAQLNSSAWAKDIYTLADKLDSESRYFAEVIERMRYNATRGSLTKFELMVLQSMSLVISNTAQALRELIKQLAQDRP